MRRQIRFVYGVESKIHCATALSCLSVKVDISGTETKKGPLSGSVHILRLAVSDSRQRHFEASMAETKEKQKETEAAVPLPLWLRGIRESFEGPFGLTPSEYVKKLHGEASCWTSHAALDFIHTCTPRSGGVPSSVDSSSFRQWEEFWRLLFNSVSLLTTNSCFDWLGAWMAKLAVETPLPMAARVFLCSYSVGMCGSRFFRPAAVKLLLPKLGSSENCSTFWLRALTSGSNKETRLSFADAFEIDAALTYECLGTMLVTDLGCWHKEAVDVLTSENGVKHIGRASATRQQCLGRAIGYSMLMSAYSNVNVFAQHRLQDFPDMVRRGVLDQHLFSTLPIKDTDYSTSLCIAGDSLISNWGPLTSGISWCHLEEPINKCTESQLLRHCDHYPFKRRFEVSKPALSLLPPFIRERYDALFRPNAL